MSDFYLDLHELAIKLSVEDLPDERGHQLIYAGSLQSNYPWIYVDFTVSGECPLEALEAVKTSIMELCGAQEGTASYLSTTISRTRVRYRLIYREDMKRKP